MNLNVIVTQFKKCKNINIRSKPLIQTLYTTSLFFSLDSLNIDMAVFEYFIAIRKKLPIYLLETGSTKAHLIRLSFYNYKCHTL